MIIRDDPLAVTKKKSKKQIKILRESYADTMKACHSSVLPFTFANPTGVGTAGASAGGGFAAAAAAAAAAIGASSNAFVNFQQEGTDACSCLWAKHFRLTFITQ
jgi:cephalosporin-C deacetylase-like acetyl esterase